MEHTLISLMWPWFVAGWLGGGHCLAMCGGLGVAAGLGARGRGQWIRLLVMNAGRITSYMMVGALLGAIISVASRVGMALVLQKSLYVASLILLACMGAYIAGAAAWFVKIERSGAVFWRLLQPVWASLFPLNTVPRTFVAGLLWGWLPCGLVYTAAIGALASGRGDHGAAVMLAFGLGTLPNLLLLGVAGKVTQEWRKKSWVRKTAGGLLVAFALYKLVAMLA
ncbi:sulfite exporter TauE/SafE family protein [Burkholderiaceae bacterium DAT-1]|nr:sulfite exporter TauE/SafE family protein [Burkholderiaceae bacterium DAT-1]